MFKHIFDHAQDIAGYPVFSLLVFFTFFVAVSIYAMKANKKYMQDMSHMPLDENEKKPDNNK